MNFNTKTEYFAAVADWKQRYAEHSNQIRVFRREYRDLQRAFSKTTQEYNSEFSAMIKSLTRYENAKYHATKLLEERATGKIEAARQRSLLAS